MAFDRLVYVTRRDARKRMRPCLRSRKMCKALEAEEK